MGGIVQKRDIEPAAIEHLRDILSVMTRILELAGMGVFRVADDEGGEGSGHLTWRLASGTMLTIIAQFDPSHHQYRYRRTFHQALGKMSCKTPNGA
ncbi:hypothetical protein GCM10019060_33110 [Novosphingobium pokkalii]|nr:hypothetical protein GCM10019060_33110 [Novosphingobium pokkalii]